MINEPEVNTPTLMNSALKWGLINGAVGIALVILFYIIDYTWLVSFKLLGVALVVTIGIIIYGGIEYRNLNGGYLSYGKAWQHGFIMLAVSGLMATIFNFILYTLVDPELPGKLTEAAVENARGMMENFGMQEGPEMDKAIAQTETDTAARFTPFGIAKGYLFQLIFSAVFALITAIFVKRNPPVEKM
jgi:hypothetical protein